MKKLFQRILDFVLFSNIFIALGAVTQACVTYYLIDATPQAHVLSILFCSTLALYNFSILLSKPVNSSKSSFRRVRWIFQHQRLSITFTIIAIILLIGLSFAFLSSLSFILLFILALISVAYNLPIFRFQNKSFGLRGIPGIKLFLIALVWSLSCVLFPIMELESKQIANHILTSDILLLTIHEFLFITAVTLPFDIRDIFQDKHYSLKTIPTLLGAQKAKILCYIFLLIECILILFTPHIFSSYKLWSILFNLLLTAWLISKSNLKRNEYFYFLLLDGMLIVQFLILCSTFYFIRVT